MALLLLPGLDCTPDRNGAFRDLSSRREADAEGCPDFRVGYDMAATDFGVDPQLRAPYAAVAQAMGDYVALSTRVLTEVTGACRSLAIDFGGSETDRSVEGRSGEEVTIAWCNLAVRKMQGALKDAVQQPGRLKFTFAPGNCAIDAPFVADCERTCSVDPSCRERELLERCPKEQQVGICSGRCTGTCEGSAAVPVSCEGTCDAQCQGACQSDCIGTCDGAIVQGGRCKGSCVGLCEGVCRGRCGGACHFAKTAAARCEGSCLGACSVPLKGLKCEADLKNAACAGNADCDKACGAVGQARGTCSAPSVVITMTEDALGAAQDGWAELKSLELHLPALYAAAAWRGPSLVAEAKGAREAAERVAADKGKLGKKGAACAAAVEAAGDQALQSLHAAIAGGKIVMAALPAQK